MTGKPTKHSAFELSEDQLFAVESFLGLRASGKTAAEIAAAIYGDKVAKHHPGLVSIFFGVLRQIGVPVEKPAAVAADKKALWAEFKAWKAANKD